METARKGKFYFENAINAEITAVLEQAGVPQWYIQSMKTIRYLFPKAHAVNYAKLALAAAWFKVYYPEAFYNVTLKDLGAEAYLSYDDEELASILETLGDADDFTAPHRHTIALLLEAHSREIPIELR
jgi:DNA polymerase-3 subunit alpha (Gram-positive type)